MKDLLAAPNLPKLTEAHLVEGRERYRRYATQRNIVSFQLWREWLDCYGTRLIDAAEPTPPTTPPAESTGGR